MEKAKKKLFFIALLPTNGIANVINVVFSLLIVLQNLPHCMTTTTTTRNVCGATHVA